ncbi:MAG: hypothetical protein ACOCVG_01485, partial [Verrucomicrobiota bacterium]
EVLEQWRDPDGQWWTRLRFGLTDPLDPETTEPPQSRELTLRGRVVHFDAVIVQFSDAFVKDGRERALYFWRRIYGDATAPIEGTPIDHPGEPPERYRALTDGLRPANREAFWDNLWALLDDLARLERYGSRAVFGNATYLPAEPGQQIVLTVDARGQIIPQLR